MTKQPISVPLNDVQLMLLRLFSRQMNDQEIESLRAVLMNHYESLLQKEVNAVIESKVITRDHFDAQLNSQQRTK